VRIDRVKALNFKGFRELDITFPDSKTILIVGPNGAGKTTVCDVIAGAILGPTFIAKNNRFRIIKEGNQQAELTVFLADEKTGKKMKIERIFDKQGGIKLTASDGSQIFSAKEVSDLLDAFSLNPISFSELDPKQQAVSLGIDTSEYDKRYKSAYDARTIENREVKRLQTFLENTAKPDKNSGEPKDILPIQAKIAAAEQYNSERQMLVRKSNDAKAVITSAEQKIAELLSQVEEQRNLITTTQTTCARLDNELEAMPEKDLAPLHTERDEIIAFNGAVAGNRKAIADRQALEREYREACEKQELAQKSVDAALAEKLAYIQSAKLPDGCTIDDTEGHEGELLVDGRPFNKDNYSMAERIEYGIRLLAARQLEGIKFIFVQDASLLDPEHMNRLVTMADSLGVVMVFEVVGEKTGAENEIFIKDFVIE